MAIKSKNSSNGRLTVGDRIKLTGGLSHYYGLNNSNIYVIVYVNPETEYQLGIITELGSLFFFNEEECVPV